ncbi:hypothetical protein IE53DRAFT_378882 [Violaceomyces palustris]|uniref:Uncharacterized protein n=1 Tax=Violaceomyces palustris TaxID=1673888 RepID=A0ACD0P0A6_9BASI|nr:hypothetical protein IE53DRAFT_378882 [Violaceomyces palustris]
MASPRTPGGAQPIPLHVRCEISKLGHGEVLFVGQTSFAPGLWVGVELDHPNGKNNGVVQGKRYFECREGHGVFVRSSQVHVLAPEDEFGESLQDEEEPYLERPQPKVTNHDAFKTTAPQKPSARSQLRAPSPSKSVATPTTLSRPPSTLARPRSSLAPAASAKGLGSVLGKGPASPVKPSLPGARSPVKPGTLTPSTRAPSSISSASARSVAPSTSVSRTSSPITPAAARLQRAPLARNPPASGRTSAGPSRLGQAPPITGSIVSDPKAGVGKPQTPSAARASLRPVAGARPSMISHRASTSSHANSSPSVAAASRTGMVRSQSGPTRAMPASEPLTRATSAASSTSKSEAGALSRPRTSGVSASGGGLLAMGAVDASSQAHLLDHEDDFDDEDDELMNMSLDEGDFSGELIEREEALNDEIGDETILTPSRTKSLSKLSPSASSASVVKTSPKAEKDHMSLNQRTIGHSAEVGALTREIDELRAKLRIMEKKREEDREKIRDVDRLKAEAESFLAVKPKLTAKTQELQSELRDLLKLEKDWQIQREDFERQIVDLNEQIEMATLDKEMAEEKAEAAISELSIVKEDVEELKIEVEVLKEENALYEHGEVTEGEKTSAGYIQLEKQNERLKEALIRLRDITSETEAEQKRKISELDKELMSLQDLQSSYESVCSRLANAEALVEDVKMQLDDALGAEEMLEQLTERNLLLGEKIEEMQGIIEDLEALKELNDELEETHIETEKQLQEEVDLKDMQIRENRMRNEALEANVADYEGTFSQFRELVANLQNDLETLRAEQAQERGEGAGGKDLTSQSQAMLNLNLKLQSSAMKSQAKTIELELGKLHASQAMVHLDIIRPYLPQAYFEADADAVNCLLFFQRMAHKADLIKTVVETNYDIQESLASVVPEQLIGICKMRHSLAHFAAISRQIAAVLQLAPDMTFIESAKIYRENMSVEKRIDSFIEALRREELKEVECGKEFGRFVKQFEEFSTLLGGDENDSDLAAKEVGAATLIDHDLDTLIAAIGFTKQSIAALYNDDDVEWEMGERTLEDDVFDPLQQLINNIKATKVPTRKVLRRLASLYSNDEAVKFEAIMALPPLGLLSSQLVTFATQLATKVATYVQEVRSSKMAFEIEVLVRFIIDAAREGLGKNDQKIWSSPLSYTSHLAATMNSVLSAAIEHQNVFKISGPGPWLARAAKIKADASHNVDAERQIAKLSEDARDLYRQIKARDQALQEGSIKVERLQKQLEKSKEQNDQMGEIKSGISEAQKQAKAYQEANDALQAELDALQQANDRLKQQVAEGGSSGSGGKTKGGANEKEDDQLPIASSSLETSYLLEQIESLRGALKHLKEENRLLKSVDLRKQFDLLPELSPSWHTSLPTRKEGNEEEKKEIGTPALARTTPKSVELRRAVDETKMLYDQLLRLSVSPKVVDLTKVCKLVPAPSSSSLSKVKDQNLKSPSGAATSSSSSPLSHQAPSDGKKREGNEEEGGKEEEEEGEESSSGGEEKKVQGARVLISKRKWQPAKSLPINQYLCQVEARRRIRERILSLEDKVRNGIMAATANDHAHQPFTFANGRDPVPLSSH